MDRHLCGVLFGWRGATVVRIPRLRYQKQLGEAATSFADSISARRHYWSGAKVRTAHEERLGTQFRYDFISLVPAPAAAAPPAPAPKATHRGRIRVSNSGNSTPLYWSKYLSPQNRIVATSSLADALQLEWSPDSDGLQTLSIPSVSSYRHFFLLPTPEFPPSHRYQGMIYLEQSGATRNQGSQTSPPVRPVPFEASPLTSPQLFGYLCRRLADKLHCLILIHRKSPDK